MKSNENAELSEANVVLRCRRSKAAFGKNYFDKYFCNGKKYLTYGEMFKENPHYVKNTLEKLLKFKKKGNFLDLGCSDGRYLAEASKYFNVFGIDVSNYAIKKAKKRLPKYSKQLFVGNAESQWPFKEKFFDVIFSWHTLEHLHNPKNALRNCFQHLKDDGVLFVGIPTKPFDFPAGISKNRETIAKFNKFLYPLRIRNFRWQFNSDFTHISTPWPWEIAFNWYFNPFFEPIYMQPEDFFHKLITGGFEVILKKQGAKA